MPANWRILVVIRLSGYSATVFPGVASAELQGGDRSIDDRRGNENWV